MLRGEHFLKADQIRFKAGDRPKKKFNALRPGILAIGRVGVANVEGHHAERHVCGA
jgi:hypothetical protein